MTRRSIEQRRLALMGEILSALARIPDDERRQAIEAALAAVFSKPRPALSLVDGGGQGHELAELPALKVVRGGV